MMDEQKTIACALEHVAEAMTEADKARTEWLASIGKLIEEIRATQLLQEHLHDED